MKPLISAFKNSPDRGRGLARDFRVRWALEEVEQAYDVTLVTMEELKQTPYRALQAFGQIPFYIEKENGLTLFESGAILLHIAETHDGLLPKTKNERIRAIAWMFSALNTMEPPIVEFSFFKLFEKDKPWFHERLPMIENRVKTRLADFSERLGESEWIEGSFSIADIMMVTVLRRLLGHNLIEPYTHLMNYIARAENRPAYKRAFAAQAEVFAASQKN